MIQHLMSGLCDEISRRFISMQEDAIWTALIRAEGEIPRPEILKAHGLFVRVQQGTDNYEEFRWRDVPRFQIRLRFDEMKAIIEVKHL